MPLNEIRTWELTCDVQASADCRVRSHQQPAGRVTAFTLKHAHQLIRSKGWKVNNGKRGGKTTYVCPQCQRVAITRGRR